MRSIIRKRDKEVISVLILTFFLSALCFLIAFAVNDIGLFGNKTILISDMKKQYIAFYSALREGRLGSYSMEIGLGTPTIGLIAYYLSSPFSLLIFLFPADKLPTAIFFVIMLKVACASVSFCYYLIRKNELERTLCVPFSLCYSLMSFVFFYFINQFWFDALIWLPLLILSLEDILEEKSLTGTSVILIVLFISNYYISYMTGLFTALYLIYMCFCRGKSLKETVYSVLRLASAAVMAFCTAGFLLVPTFYQMIHSFGDSYDGYGAVNYSPKQLILKLFVGYFDSIGNAAAPTIFCGTLVLTLAALYFFNSRISIRARVGSAVFFGFLMLSTYLPFLDKIWHGFAYPNAFAYRYAFCISFFLITLAVQCCANLDGVRNILLMGLFAIPVLMAVFSTKLLRNMSMWTLAGEICFCAFYPLYLLIEKVSEKKRAIHTVVILVVCAEMVLNGLLVLSGVDIQNEFPLYTQYTDLHKMMDGALDGAEPNERVAYIDDERLNAGMEIGFYSPSLFSSAYDPAVAETVSKLGYEYVSISKQYKYIPGYNETDRLLGIRYRLEAQKEGIGESPVITKITVEDLGEVFPISFFIPKDRIGTKLLSSPEENQSLIKEFLSEADPDAITDAEYKGARLSALVEAGEDGAVWFSAPSQEGWNAFVDGQKTDIQKTLDYFIAVPVPKGTHVVEMKYTAPYQTTGILLSVIGVLMILGLYGYERKRALL
ncbi:MAG: YfhO family protein [Oscillospiraceae bacterium]|nr:YfhO family protein [Oscillospiraceae bacterium]